MNAATHVAQCQVKYGPIVPMPLASVNRYLGTDWIRSGDDKAKCFFIAGNNIDSSEFLPLGPWRSEGEALSLTSRLREFYPSVHYDVQIKLLSIGGFDELDRKRRVALGKFRVLINTAYAKKNGLFPVIDGWTNAYYVVSSDLPREDGCHESDRATPIGVVGPFADAAEAERAMGSLFLAFPNERFEICHVQFASGICLPKHLPVEQKIAREKISRLPQKWEHAGGFVIYYVLDSSTQCIIPFGKIGPFPTPSEAKSAMERIESKFPEKTVLMHRCAFADDLTSDAELDEEHARAFVKLAALGV
ncbi:hypothetical protein N5D48_05290 [Pseudomonas sp. GD03858]|uniref:hypothetical protein n=1 Tax=unclassified Pseudomonas TaxID=196821 RepID=UPI00244C4175|nr:MULTISPECIES: hypothetical protein [unclassified Pseudomonas]MDH0646192.1 hypothetical protein [Pseudomonas sp. GD03867]MDH0661809.1 hypothetical protein [Pseudomonas sp. GD03858]